MNRRWRFVVPAVTAALIVSVAPSSTAAGFDLTDVAQTDMSGVSPFAMSIDATTDRVFHSAGEAGGWLMSTCAVGGSCTDTALSPDFGSDYTQVTLTDGSQRAYFVLPDASGAKEIATAPVTYAGGVPTLGATQRLGITATAQQRAWGVPDSVVTPDGRVRLYWVDEGESARFEPTGAQQRCMAKALGRKGVSAVSSGKKVTSKAKKALKKCGVPLSALTSRGSRANEIIVSATSTDSSGTQFVRDSGTRTTGGYVDSDVIHAADGNWVMLLSTGPGEPPQRLFVATSRDGLAWKIDPTPLTSASVNALDPTAIQTGPNSWRVYYAQSPKATPFSGHRLMVGTLTR